MRSRAAGWTGVLWVAVALAGRGEDDLARQVVVLANRRVSESVELARYYMERRGIPADRLCALDLPAGETIVRGVYEARLRDPLLEFLRERKLIEQVRRDPDTVQRHESEWQTLSSSVRFLVSVHGVPVRIADTRRRLGEAIANALTRMDLKDLAAVDSELAALLLTGVPLRGPHGNPLFNQLSLAQSSGAAALVLVAARLDGPDAGTVRRLIDETIAAEEFGLLGRFYFDRRGIERGGYALGDYWLAEAAERCAREGYECVVDEAEPVWGDAFPLDEAAFYLGWYAEHAVGPFVRPGFRFRPGAVAYHIHSASAAVLRSPSERWAGPLLAAGAAATMGCVSEPMLHLTPHLHLFTDRLCRGRTFGEAAYLAMTVLSWQVTVVGDPLYRPFQLSAEEQILRLEKAGRPEAEWAWLRKINLMVRDGRFNTALDVCRRKIEETGSVVLREKLADLYMRNELADDALREYAAVIDQATTAEPAVRAGARAMLVLRLLGRAQEADQLEARIRERWKSSPVLPWLETGRER